MKHVFLPLILLSFSIQAQTQDQTEAWMQQLKNPKYKIWTLKPDNLINCYINFDLSDPLTPIRQIVGFIGTDYRRIRIDFSSVTKDSEKHDVYHVTGYSIVSGNKCDFTGTITIEQIREFEDMHYGPDLIYKDSALIAQGVIIGKYLFKENPTQKHVGTFEGIMTSWWYGDQNGDIHYDDIEKHSDSYRNNQYAGTWIEYGKTTGKPCNWGECRIPFSGDLDIGAGAFSVNPDYKDRGWEDY